MYIVSKRTSHFVSVKIVLILIKKIYNFNKSKSSILNKILLV